MRGSVRSKPDLCRFNLSSGTDQLIILLWQRSRACVEIVGSDVCESRDGRRDRNTTVDFG